MQFAVNPILRGFNPDPSVVRVGEDYYIATSTFEWYPGVQIHHSTNLVDWKLIARPLRRESQLDLLGVPDSGGVWAPCLSYFGDTFYLVFTNVKSFDGVWKDTPNFLVTSSCITGEWSEPIYLSSFGFDGSLFHDTDGRSWYTSMLVDHRKGKFFGGIICQEFDKDKLVLIGEAVRIFGGTALGFTEGPHLYKKDEYYYLITAEGGTEYGHAVTIARAKQLTGPYEVHPDNPFMTTRNNPGSPLQKVGHADLFTDTSGNWYATFLVARPLSERGRCLLGRETALEEIIWKDGWPYLPHGTKEPRVNIPIAKNAAIINGKGQAYIQRDDFDSTLDINFQSLRIPFDESWISLTERESHVTLRGRESLSSTHFQSMIARRIQHFEMEASAAIDFTPLSFQQMAGLIFYYNTAHFHYLYISADDLGNRRLQILTYDNFKHIEAFESPIVVPDIDPLFLKGALQEDSLQFYYSTNGTHWIPVGCMLDATILSDDYIQNGDRRYRPAFTGSFVGLCCQDLSGLRTPAHFDWFEYTGREIETKENRNKSFLNGKKIIL